MLGAGNTYVLQFRVMVIDDIPNVVLVYIVIICVSHRHLFRYKQTKQQMHTYKSCTTNQYLSFFNI